MMKDLKIQRQLGERELQIFNAEMQRQQKNVLVSYLLWFFLGWAGAHKFYLGKTLWGIVYLLLGVGGYALFWGGFVAAVFSPDAAETAGGASALGIIVSAAWGLLMLWDLITLPSQHNKREANIRRELLEKLSQHTEG